MFLTYVTYIKHAHVISVLVNRVGNMKSEPTTACLVLLDDRQESIRGNRVVMWCCFTLLTNNNNHHFSIQRYAGIWFIFLLAAWQIWLENSCICRVSGHHSVTSGSRQCRPPWVVQNSSVVSFMDLIERRRRPGFYFTSQQGSNVTTPRCSAQATIIARTRWSLFYQ